MVKVIKTPAPVKLDDGTVVSFQDIMLGFLLADPKWGKTLEVLESRRAVKKKVETMNGELVLTLEEHALLEDVARFPTRPYNPEVADPAIDLIHAILVAENRSE